MKGNNIEIRRKYTDRIFYKSAHKMSELPDGSVNLVVTSPPYFNIKDYSCDGHQQVSHSSRKRQDIGAIGDFSKYIASLATVWKECERVLAANGKLCINVPLMPMLKRQLSTHYNRDIFDLQSAIQQSILKDTGLFLMDIYIWNRTNSSKRLMFGSYPYPRNFYAQNTIEFIAVYVKDGVSHNSTPRHVKEASKLTQKEFVEYTRQIWNIPIPNRSDQAFGHHPAIMPDEIARRCIRLFSFVGDLVLDPFAGSGTTLKTAASLQRKFVGYEIYGAYKQTIDKKFGSGADAGSKGRKRLAA